MFNFPYIVELLSPKRSDEDNIDGNLDRFALRYNQIIESGCGLSIPDNPMGQPRLGALESIELRNLSFLRDKVVVNLNTFHTKKELDGLLEKAASADLKYMLVVRGDGGPLLPTLDPKSINGQFSVATSIDLIRYINDTYPDQFVTGAAFNPFKPMPVETNRLKQKLSAGARFVVTQPIVGKNESVSQIEMLGVPLVIEAWMSKNIDLFYKSVGKEKDEHAEPFDPVDNLKTLHKFYPESCVYLSMLGFKQNWQDILPRLSKMNRK
ncbi:methylenetetrahydrofolate reductase [Desulfosarcina sp.]|uniref:methylenetetrahydrofolate reductase n=1 Tax=Desulfosarcina sp. TaxID=2027861 RepID=UPI003569B8DE